MWTGLRFVHKPDSACSSRSDVVRFHVSVKWYLPTVHSGHVCPPSLQIWWNLCVGCFHKTETTARSGSRLPLCLWKWTLGVCVCVKMCIAVTVTLAEPRCCHDDATGKVGQQAPATPLLAWQQGWSIKPEQQDDSLTHTHTLFLLLPVGLQLCLHVGFSVWWLESLQCRCSILLYYQWRSNLINFWNCICFSSISGKLSRGA